MAEFHFYTDIAFLDNSISTGPGMHGEQFPGQEFGPRGLINSSHHRYNLSNLHYLKSVAGLTPMAIAVASGKVMVQPISTSGYTSSHVNIILKPTEQPECLGMRVKYFIYRGIQKTSVISGTNIATLNNDDTDSDLKKIYWEEKEATVATPPQKVSGIEISDAASITIGEAFANASGDGDFVTVSAGQTLGILDLGTGSDLTGTCPFGFDIVIESAGFDPELSEARLLVNAFDIPNTEVDPMQMEFLTIPLAPEYYARFKKGEFIEFHKPDKILHYLDPCAFFGSFAKQGLKCLENGQEVICSNLANHDSHQNIYSKVLKSFVNKNRTYVDIRTTDDRPLHINHDYGNYKINSGPIYAQELELSIECKWGPTATNAINKPYRKAPVNGTTSSGLWPIIIIENSDFPASNSTDHNILSITLPTGKEITDLTAFPTINESTTSNNSPSIVIENGIKPDSESDLPELIVNEGVSVVELKLPNDSSSSNQTVVLSSLIKLRYLKKYHLSNVYSIGTEIHQPYSTEEDSLSTIFRVDDAKIGNIGSGNYKNLLRSRFINDFMDIGCAKDSNGNLSFIAYPSTEPLPDFFSFESNNALDSEQIAGPCRLRRSKFEKDPDSYDYIEFTLDTTSEPPLRIPPTSQLRRNLFGLILESDWKTSYLSSGSVSIADLQSDLPIYLGVTPNAISNNQTDDLGHPFSSFHLTLRGFVVKSGGIGADLLEVAEVPLAKTESGVNVNIKLYGYGNI